jgi:hypothetical protein
VDAGQTPVFVMFYNNELRAPSDLGSSFGHFDDKMVAGDEVKYPTRRACLLFVCSNFPICSCPLSGPSHLIVLSAVPCCLAFVLFLRIFMA